MKRILTVGLALLLAGCASNIPKHKVDCTGYLYIQTTMRTYTMPITEMYTGKYGDNYYKVSGTSPFLGTSFVREDSFDKVVCSKAN